MISTPGHRSGGGEGAFLILPDREGALTSISAARNYPVLCRHPSGRPFIAGWVGGDRIAVHQTDSATSVLLGQIAETPGSIERRLRSIASGEPYSNSRELLGGSFHVLSSINGTASASGTASYSRRVFYSQLSGLTVASNRADILAALGRGELDLESVAIRLVVPPAPAPTDSSSMWKSVHPVPAHRRLEISASGRVAMSEWWTTPDPATPMTQAKERLGQAIENAVALRTSDSLVSADLSGGMDSTPLAYLAWKRFPKVAALTMIGMTREDDDTDIAIAAAKEMVGVDHIILPVSGMVNTFDGIINPAPLNDEPFFGLQIGRQSQIAQMMAERGSTMHITGHGGDEVFTVPSSYIATLVRENKRLSVDHIRGLRALKKWSLSDVASMCRDKRSYQEWVADLYGSMGANWPTALAKWGPPVYVPDWLNRDALEQIRQRFDKLERPILPHSPQPAQHFSMELIRTAGRISRLAGNTYAQHGVSLAYPYLDDNVLDLALQVKLHERGTPWAFKPLLRSSVEGRVPTQLISRTTKNDMTEDVIRDIREVREQLLEMCDDSILSSMGLIDQKKFRNACTSQHAPGPSLPSFVMAMNCESWLRSQLCLGTNSEV